MATDMKAGRLKREFGPADLFKGWQKLARAPGRSLVFSRLLGVFVPYSGTIGARIEAVAPGYAKATLQDRRRVRNHLNSIHAMALANFGELVTGLAVNTALPETARAILTRFTIDYHHKARGVLTAECRIAPIPTSEKREIDIEAPVVDSGGVTVCTVKARWLVGPVK